MNLVTGQSLMSSSDCSVIQQILIEHVLGARNCVYTDEQNRQTPYGHEAFSSSLS